MTSPRQKEIEKVRHIRTFYLILVFSSFYISLMYLWVWMLETTMFSFGLSGMLACGVALILMLPWEKTTARLDRLLKYEVLFLDFFEAMITDMEENDEEKGDSWLTVSEKYLRQKQNRKINQLQSKKRTVADDFDHQKELANYCAMVWLRGRQLE